MRFIDSSNLSAKENMQIDELLVNNFEGSPTFRLYSWGKGSFTIGRFQKIEDIKNHQELGSNWAKRITGGGVLLHGCDISYSLIIPANYFGNKSVKESYEFICSFILDFYQNLNLHVEFAKDTNLSLSKSPFCQVGFEPYDIIVNGKKLGGNAQRRTKKLIFQHGSIPLKRDSRKFSGYSLEECGITLDEDEGKTLLKKSFEKIFNFI